MSYQPKCSLPIAFLTQEKHQRWESMMNSDQRNWFEILEVFPKEMATYIAEVRIATLNSLEASREYCELDAVFEWAESEFTAEWSIDVYTNSVSTIEYQSFSEMSIAVLEDQEPKQSASNAFYEGNMHLDFEWSDVSELSLTIADIRIKKK